MKDSDSMINPVASLVTAAAQQMRRSFHGKAQHTESRQSQFLQTLLRTYQDTEMGRQLKLTAISSVDQFRAQVPIRPYADYEPWIEKAAAGKANVLTPDPVTYLNFTSGSTGKRKLIPVTWRSRQFRVKATNTSLFFALGAAAQKRQTSLGKILLTSSIELEGHTSAGIPYGPVSVGDLRQNNVFKRSLMAHPLMALEPVDSLARHYVCFLFALANPRLKVIGANFPVLALKLCEHLEQQAESLLTDLEQGTLASWLKLDEGLRSQLLTRLKAHPQRAAQLRLQRQQTGRFTPQMIWPHLNFITTALGGTSDFYLKRFPDYFGDTPIFGGIYASAEAVFGAYHSFNNDGAVLAIESGFYEFIPPEQWDVEQPKTLLAEQVQVGECYRILVTNYNGFYRYDIGDVVEVVGFYGKAPIITFRHRRGGLLSSVTEKTTEYHVIQVMQTLMAEFEVALTDFCITLSKEETPPPYLVNIELQMGDAIANPQAFLERFDQELQTIHASYAVKRRTQVPPPQLRILQPGSFATMRQQMIAQGIPESHLKFPHISEDRQFLTNLPVEQNITLSRPLS
ncbi:GH3 auxin-responsive promoter family protein [Acaryochloris thomasi]|nr:GH3 auxin-responsive promoter family protein [Acaryochloris thomasi]